MDTFKDVMLIANPFLLAALGFYFNRRFEQFSREVQRLEERRATRINYLKNKLQMFLDPVLQAIELDNITWRQIQSLSDSKHAFPEELSHAVEHEVLLENHRKASDCVRNNLHFIAPDHPLRRCLIKYLKHVAVYSALRKTELDLNPIDVGVKFPAKLEELLREEFRETQAQYQAIFES